MKIHSIANYILSQFDANKQYVINQAILAEEAFVERETEKAVLVRFVSDFGSFTSWVPKVAINAAPSKWEIEKTQKEEERINKYLQLVEWAKENGVKGIRERIKKVTLLEKIKAAGLTIPDHLI